MMRVTAGLWPVLIVAGCHSDPPAPAGPRPVGVAELGRETDHLVFFSYAGSDAESHYFETAEGRRYKVPLAEWANPAPYPPGAGVRVFVTVKDGRLTAPDPAEMAALTEDEVLHRPYKKPRR